MIMLNRGHWKGQFMIILNNEQWQGHVINYENKVTLD
jgi:hypothetical protein